MKVNRKIIHIDENLCDGCGLCVPSCHEKAIQLVDTAAGKKARLVKEIYCDGLGDCLGACPAGAITIAERLAAPYDELATAEHIRASRKSQPGCPSAMMQSWKTGSEPDEPVSDQSCLQQWPIQLHLVPTEAPFFQGADLLVLADCAAVAYGALQSELVRNKAVVMACPKLDDTSPYLQKLAAIITNNQLKSITVVHMQVPCCKGIVTLVHQARNMVDIDVPLKRIEISIKGEKLAKVSVADSG
ncbi:4Fe-4S dicluster domain-containing protein [candidate division KSB1 bacterium]|nr:4Fe-4S dicluster domain-containing protein [candidate division KSB1 bacterium]